MYHPGIFLEGLMKTKEHISLDDVQVQNLSRPLPNMIALQPVLWLILSTSSQTAYRIVYPISPWLLDVLPDTFRIYKPEGTVSIPDSVIGIFELT